MSETYIILVNYNNHDDTLKCLESIAEAGYEESVIVVDNNSTVPGLDEIVNKFPSTILIKNKKNIGFGRANNIAIEWIYKNTICENVFFLNNDTVINKDTIPTLEKAFSYNENIAITTPKIVMMHDPNLLWYGGGEIDWKKCSAKIPGYLSSATNGHACSSRFVSFASGCAMLIKKNVLDEVGGFDKRFFMYVEDLELCLRVINNNYKIFYSSDATVYHKGQGSQRNSKKFYPIDHAKNPNLPFYIYHLTKNRLLTIRQHYTGINKLQFWSYFPLFMTFRVTQYFFNKRFNAIKAIMKGIIHSYKDEEIDSNV